MAKEATLTVEGQIDEIYPDGRFGVMLDNQHRVIVYTAGRCGASASARWSATGSMSR